MALQNPGIHIRLFMEGDIPFALEQTEREGWDATEGFVRTLMTHDPEGVFIAEVDGACAGMVTTTRYAESAWIGNLIVPPEFRKREIGSALMQHAIGHLQQQGVQTLRLEGDPLGINIYRRLGFVDEYDSPRFRIEQYRCAPSVHVCELSALDVPAVLEFDAQVFGDDRSRMLQLLFRSVVSAFRIPKTGQLEGYLLVQNSAAGYRLGPWISRSVEAGRDLLTTALALTANQAVIVAMPGPNGQGAAMLMDAGFVRTPSSLRMLRGPVAARGMPELVYGLAGGAIG